MKNNVPRFGDIVCVNRGLYKHYGIYVNNDRVIHFAPKKGVEINPEDALIMESGLRDFLKGGNLEIDTLSPAKYSPEDTVQRAVSCLGTNKGAYNLVFHNCEHFARWCKSGIAESRQVQNAVKGIVAAAAAITVAVVAAKLLDDTSKKDAANHGA
jgi:hypothetical protein